MSKMGISTIASYRGAQLFEIVGLAAKSWSCASPARQPHPGRGFAELQADATSVVAQRLGRLHEAVELGGLLKYVHGGEYHMYNPDVIASCSARCAAATTRD